VIAAQYSGPLVESSTVYAAGKRALDQLVASLQLAAPGCLDSTDRRCGAFYTTAANSPIRITPPVQPLDAQAGQPLTLAVAADDPDADDIRLTGVTTADVCSQIIDAEVVTKLDLHSLVRARATSVEGRFGPWRSPPRPPGHATFTVSETFPIPGQHSIHLSVRSYNTAFPLTLDPSGSFVECLAVKVTVR
jgi:hypothetical protein